MVGRLASVPFREVNRKDCRSALTSVAGASEIASLLMLRVAFHQKVPIVHSIVIDVTIARESTPGLYLRLVEIAVLTQRLPGEKV